MFHVYVNVVTLLTFHLRTSERRVLAFAFQTHEVTGTSHGVDTHACIPQTFANEVQVLRCILWIQVNKHC